MQEKWDRYPNANNATVGAFYGLHCSRSATICGNLGALDPFLYMYVVLCFYISLKYS